MDQKKGAFLDIDQTLYNGYLFYEWAKQLESQDVFSVLDIVKMDEPLILYKIGHYSYIEAATKVSECIADMLVGKEVDEVIAATQSFTQKIGNKFYEYAKPLTEKLKDSGFLIVLVTNEPDFLAEMIKDILGAHDALGLDFTIKRNKFAGQAINDLATEHAKEAIVRKYAQDSGIDLNVSLAMGDAESDVEMLKACGKGFLINTSAKMQKHTEGTNIISISREEVLSKVFC